MMFGTTEARQARATLALTGLSVGDAFGEQFFGDSDTAEWRIIEQAVPPAPWRYTDDTEMALSVISVLRQCGRIDQDVLALAFAARYDRSRGYGPAMHRILSRIADGEHWTKVAGSAFDGQGTYGNGAAMRSAPIGAYFADDLSRAASEAALGAAVTHAHPEGIAGGVAVAVAAALACQIHDTAERPPSRTAFLDQVLAHIPVSEVRSKLRRARDLEDSTTPDVAAMILGNGTGLSAQDTVPFSLWCAARHPHNFEAALWTTVSVLGDRDTTCAIVGGIVACFTGQTSIPPAWLSARESLPG